MECCGGKGSPTPISRSRYVVGSVLLLGYHGAVGAVLEAAALVNRCYGPAARFHRRYVADLVYAIIHRDRIVFHGEEARGSRPGSGR